VWSKDRRAWIATQNGVHRAWDVTCARRQSASVVSRLRRRSRNPPTTVDHSSSRPVGSTATTQRGDAHRGWEPTEPDNECSQASVPTSSPRDEATSTVWDARGRQLWPCDRGAAALTRSEPGSDHFVSVIHAPPLRWSSIAISATELAGAASRPFGRSPVNIEHFAAVVDRRIGVQLVGK
jgi:hypothetical protein